MTEHYTHFDLEAKRNVIETIPLPNLISSENPPRNELEYVIYQSSSEIRRKVLCFLECRLSPRQKQELLKLIS